MPTLNLGRVRFNMRGPYDPNSDYLTHDVVTDDGQSYVCIADVTGTGPNDAGGATNWEGMLLRGADYNAARDQAVQAASNAGSSATAASQSANAAASDRGEAQVARDKSQAWAESNTAPEPGSKSAKTWAAEAASYGDPNQHNVTANGTADTRTAAEWAGQTLSNQQAINGLGTAATARAEHLASSPYCTDIGTANAYALSVNYTKAAPTSYSDGDQYRFRAGTSNTGASTVNINGLGVKPLVTVTGVALPAGYIRTDVDTKITYDAANERFITDRAPENGENANGWFTRWANGRASAHRREVQVVNTDVSSGALYAGGVSSRLFPCVFTSIWTIDIFCDSETGEANLRWVAGNFGEDVTLTRWPSVFICDSSPSNASTEISYNVEGLWYES
ncbi:MAG: hypothetical protein GYB54_02830 [Gammaproteobacteria bacterium]|nr:hypothetical protein [Gammaproteobacteria bacterium]